ncbi:M15 family metallopeptidase [bacterium]|nr:M15 family metallopeptidase [bacterium]
MNASQTDSILTGQTESHLSPVSESKARLHQAVVIPLENLRKKAHRAGFELEVVSGFRSFEAQVAIWNAKASGQRAVLDARGKVLDISQLSPRELVYSILHWSALPGASRHHWGTDLDVIDRLSVPPGYSVQLTEAEVRPGGMFGALHDWLDRHMHEEGFFRPYQRDMGGVQPERWHLSHSPTAQPLFKAHNPALLEAAIAGSALTLKDEILAELPEIFDRFFLRISDAPRV